MPGYWRSYLARPPDAFFGCKCRGGHPGQPSAPPESSRSLRALAPESRQVALRALRAIQGRERHGARGRSPVGWPRPRPTSGLWSAVLSTVRPATVMLHGRCGAPTASTVATQCLSLVSGNRDQMQPRMWRAYESLAASGFAASYFSLGEIGHAYPADMAERMVGVLSSTWLLAHKNPIPSNSSVWLRLRGGVENATVRRRHRPARLQK